MNHSVPHMCFPPNKKVCYSGLSRKACLFIWSCVWILPVLLHITQQEIYDKELARVTLEAEKCRASVWWGCPVWETAGLKLKENHVSVHLQWQEITNVLTQGSRADRLTTIIKSNLLSLCTHMLILPKTILIDRYAKDNARPNIWVHHSLIKWYVKDKLIAYGSNTYPMELG